jgi:hypothetical protein
MRSSQSVPPKQWLNPPNGLGIRLRRLRYTSCIVIPKISVLRSLKRSLVLLLLVSLPLQAQAAAWMACHASFESVSSVKLEQAVHHHSEADPATDHSAHAATASDATASDATTATGSAAAQASGCALCAASCFMAHGLPAAAQHTFTQAEFRTLIPGPQLHFASVVLEGLLRPPRS